MYGVDFSIWEIVKMSLSAMGTVALLYVAVLVWKKLFGKSDDEEDRRRD
jgi:hypothetical protein